MPSSKRRKVLVDYNEKPFNKTSDLSASDERGGGNSECFEGDTDNGIIRSTKDREKLDDASFSVITPTMSTAQEVSISDETLSNDLVERNVSEQVSSSGRVIKPTNKSKYFNPSSARLIAKTSQDKVSLITGQPPQPQQQQFQSRAQQALGRSASKTKVSAGLRGKKECSRGNKRRTWDLWDKFEQEAFFEGLFEHGKDFDAIYNLIVHRSKKRDIPSVNMKTKKQVRYMYYRMWQKISKHIHMGSRVDKRALFHLNELIHQGYSRIKEYSYVTLFDPVTGRKRRRKGPKRVRVLRTPVCHVLKKLNNIEEPKHDLVCRLPNHVTVELTPRSSSAWLKVHNLSHNPRVRFQVSANRSIASIIKYLDKKWIGSTCRLRECLIGEDSQEKKEEMFVCPHHSYSLTPLSLVPQRNTAVNLLSFNRYWTSILSRTSPSTASKEENISCVCNKANASDDDIPKCSAISSDGGDDSIMDGPVHNTMKISDTDRESPLGDVNGQLSRLCCCDENAVFPDGPLYPASDGFGEHLTVREEVSKLDCDRPLSIICDGEAKGDSGEILQWLSPQLKDKPCWGEGSRCMTEEDYTMDMRRTVDNALKGFCLDSGQLVSLAQLSLVLGKTSHIRLEYEWRPVPGCQHLPAAGESLFLSNMLRRLSCLAGLEYRGIVGRTREAVGSKQSCCTLCGNVLERGPRKYPVKVCDAATETEPISAREVRAMHPVMLNSNGTLIGMSGTAQQRLTADTDGVFRIPMPAPVQFSLPLPAAIPENVARNGRQSLVATTTAAISSLSTEPVWRLPRTRKKQSPKRILCNQRLLLPKLTDGPMTVLTPLKSMDNAEMPFMKNIVSEVVTQNNGQHDSVEGRVCFSGGQLTPLYVPGVFGNGPVVSSLPHPPVEDVTTSTITVTTSVQHMLQLNSSQGSLSSMLDLSFPEPSTHDPDDGDKFLALVTDEHSVFSSLLTGDKKMMDCGVIADDNVEGVVGGNGGEYGLATTSPHTISPPPNNNNGLPSLSSKTIVYHHGVVDVSLENSLPSFSLPSPRKECAIDGGALDLDLSSLSGFLLSPDKSSCKKRDLLSSAASSCIAASPSSHGTSYPTIAGGNMHSFFSDSSQDSLGRLDVDGALRSVMIDSSIDYSSKFEKLAHHLEDNTVGLHIPSCDGEPMAL